MGLCFPLAARYKYCGLSVSSLIPREHREKGQEVRVVTKADLVRELAKVCNFTTRGSELVVETISKSITEALAKGDKVELRGFGSFRVRRRKPRRRRNPKTGSIVAVPSKRVPFFKVGKRLRELVNA